MGGGDIGGGDYFCLGTLRGARFLPSAVCIQGAVAVSANA